MANELSCLVRPPGRAALPSLWSGSMVAPKCEPASNKGRAAQPDGRLPPNYCPFQYSKALFESWRARTAARGVAARARDARWKSKMSAQLVAKFQKFLGRVETRPRWCQNWWKSLQNSYVFNIVFTMDFQMEMSLFQIGRSTPKA